MYEWYIRFGLFILLIILLVIIIVFVLNRNTNKNTTRGVKYKDLSNANKLTNQLFRGEISMNDLKKGLQSMSTVNTTLSNSLMNYAHMKQVESVAVSMEISKSIAILNLLVTDLESFEKNNILACIDLLKNSAKNLSETEESLLSSKIAESPLNFLAEMQKVINTKDDKQKLISETIQDMITSVSPAKITDESAKESNSSGEVAEQTQVEDNDVNEADSSNDIENDRTAKLSEREVEINAIRESEDVIAEVNFRQLLPTFGNGIDSALASCQFKATHVGRTNLKSTSKWEISELSSADLHTLHVAFRQKRSDTTKPYLEAYNYLEEVIKSRSENQ